jgi:hypothetical protein
MKNRQGRSLCVKSPRRESSPRMFIDKAMTQAASKPSFTVPCLGLEGECLSRMRLCRRDGEHSKQDLGAGQVWARHGDKGFQLTVT